MNAGIKGLNYSVKVRSATASLFLEPTKYLKENNVYKNIKQTN